MNRAQRRTAKRLNVTGWVKNPMLGNAVQAYEADDYVMRLWTIDRDGVATKEAAAIDGWTDSLPETADELEHL